jgi:Family of unknown function (DUF6256)
MTPTGPLALSLADRQALVPMAAGYLILMSALAFGLHRLYRPPPPVAAKRPPPARSAPPGPAPPGPAPPGPAPPGATAPGSAPPGAEPRARAGWAALLRHVAGTVVGGYLLLMAVVVAYYFGVARVGPGFLESAATGTALLLGLAAPVFAALSWLADRRWRS